MPPGLGELEAHHRAFAELFYIPEGLLAAAAEPSAPLRGPKAPITNYLIVQAADPFRLAA